MMYYFTFMRPFIVTNFFTKNQPDAPISKIYWGVKFYMFRAVPLPIIRSLFSLHSALVYVIKALSYKPAGRGFDSRWCHWNFSVT